MTKDTLDDADLDDASEAAEKSKDKWCCLSRVIALQEDFVNKKLEIQHYLERRGHVCMFYPKFYYLLWIRRIIVCTNILIDL